MMRTNAAKPVGVVVIDTGNDALRERYALSMARMESLGTDVPEAFCAYFNEAARFVKESCTDQKSAKKDCTVKDCTDEACTDRKFSAPVVSNGQRATESGQALDELQCLLRLWRAELGALPYLYASGRLMDVDILLETLIQIENVFTACGQEGDSAPPQKAVRDVIYSYLYDYLPVFAEEAADAFLSEHAAASLWKREDEAQERRVSMPQGEEKQKKSGQKTGNAVPVRLLDCVLFPEWLIAERLAAAETCDLPHWQLSDLAFFQGDRLEAMLLRALSEALRERQEGTDKQDRKHRANAASAAACAEFSANAVSVTKYQKRNADAASAMECPANAAPGKEGAERLGVSALFCAPFTPHQQKVNRHMLEGTAALWQQAFSGKSVH